MDWEALGTIAEIVGAAGVIISLIYVALQIKLNTNAAKQEATRHLVLANSEAAMEAVRDGELAEILQRGLYQQGSLTPTEQMRYNLYFFSYYNQVDYAYERFREGQLDERSWNKIANEIAVYIAAPGGKIWWKTDKARFSREFVGYVENVLAEQSSPPHILSIPEPDKT